MKDLSQLTRPLPIGRVLFGIVVFIALVTAGRQIVGYLPEFSTWVNSLGFWGPAIFMAGYIGATVIFVPGSVLTLTAGAIFGLAKGAAIVFVSATIGATIAFLIARHVARQIIEDRLKGNYRFAAIDRAIGKDGFKITLLLRLSPLFPFNLLNYALGLTSVRFTDYVVASVGMLPGTFLYIYYGKVAGDVVWLVGGAPFQGTAYYAVLFVGLAATIVLTTLVTRIARRALKQVTGS